MTIKRIKDVLEEVTMAQYFTLKELSEKFHDFERTKDKMIETDSNLGV